MNWQSKDDEIGHHIESTLSNYDLATFCNAERDGLRVHSTAQVEIDNLVNKVTCVEE